MIHLANLHPSQPGSSRLSHLGFDVDDRPLGALLDRPAAMPNVVPVSAEQIR